MQSLSEAIWHHRLRQQPDSGLTESKCRPAKAKPADLCRPNVVIRGETYTARPVRPETSGVVRAWRLASAT